MKRWHRIVIGAAATVVILLALIAAIAPPVIKKEIIRRVEVATGRKMSVGSVSVNPLTWTARMDAVRLSERDGAATFFAFSSVRVSVSPRSLVKGAPVVSSLELASPYLSVQRQGANQFNFSDLLQRMESAPPHPREKTDSRQFCINNITISRGTIDFLDKALPVEKRHVVSDVSLKVPFISNMAYVADDYITPHFSATVNGSRFHLNGRLRKLPTSAEVALGIDVKELSLPFYMPYMPARTSVTIPSGTLDSALEVTYRVSDRHKPQVLLTGSARVDHVRVDERGGAPLASLEKGEIVVKEADLFGRRYIINSINLQRPQATVTRSRTGEWNFSRLGSRPKETGASAPKQEQGRPAALQLESLKITDGKLTVDDRQPEPRFSTTVEGIAVDLAGYDSTATRPATFALSAATSRREKLAVKGTVVPASQEYAARVEAGDIPLAAYYPYLAPWLTAPVSGRAGVAGDLLFSQKSGLRVEKGSISLDAVAAAFGDGDGIMLGKVLLENGSVDMKERKLHVERLSVHRSDVRLSRDREGNLSPLKLVRQGGQQTGKPSPPAGTGSAALAWSIGAVIGDGMQFRFRDAMKEDAPEFSLSKTAVEVKNLNGQGKGAVPFKASAVYGKNGSIAMAGDYVLQPGSLRGTFDLRRITLTDFEAYFPPELNITLADGNADASGKVSLAMTNGRWSGGFSGDAGIRSFYCLDAEDEDLLKWESLQLEGIAGTIAPYGVTISDVVLNHYYAKIVVEENGTLNLQHLMAKEERETAAPQQTGAAQTQPAVQQPKGAAPGAAQQTAARSVKIGAVVLQDGILNFTDRHLHPNYASTFYNLGGRVSGLTSEATRLADVDLRGNLENQSPLTITGQINPLRDDLFVDLKMRFNDIELSPLSPYSSTYLGYLIDKGKLFLDLKYHIEQKKLESQNNVFLDQLTLGNKVDSPQATSLPVRLAIALLKDRNGEIHLDLPVSGRTDDPKFSVWGVVLQMLKNLAMKAATAPFGLLQSLFGSKHDFSSVFFGYGSAALSPAEQEKLVKLAGALKDRPALKIELTGYADRERDPEGLRKEMLERKIRTEKFLEMVKERRNQGGESPEKIKVTEEEYPKYLKLVYRKEKFPKPRTLIGTVKDLPDAEMKKLILANTVVGTKDLQALTADRMAAVRDFLVEKGQLNAARIFIKGGDLFKEPARQGDGKGRVEFGMAAE